MATDDEDQALAPTIGSDPATAATVAPAVAARGSATLAIGARLGGRYVIEAFLGEGGMGAVYRALDETLGERVALKVVRGAHATSELLRDEVRIAQQVTHRNVCRTYDLEDVDGFHLVKMELVEGDTLAQVLARDGKLAVERAVAIARAIADGLAAAHARGIVHRDLKPGNVMVSGERVVLMDFGLAQREGETEIAGTPGYMSPEQLAGTPLDTRTDLYALGCVLYEMLAGARVFDGNAIELAARHASIAAPDVRARRAETPRWLAHATARLLAKDPRDRTAGVDRLAAGPSRRWLALPVGGTVVAAAAIVVWRVTSATHWAPQVKVVKPIFDGEIASAPALSPDGTRLAYASDREQRGVHRVYVAPVDGEHPVAITAPGASMTRVRWTRDGSALLGILDGRHVGRLPASGGEAVDTGIIADDVDDCGDALALRVATFDSDRLVLWRDGHADELYRSPGGTVLSAPRCAPRTGAIVVTESAAPGGGAAGDLVIIDRARHATHVTHDHSAGAATFTPDGRALVFPGPRDGKIRLFVMPAAGGTRHELTREGGPDLDPDVSADGRSVAFQTQPTSTAIIASAPGREPETITLERQSLRELVPLRTRGALLAERAGEPPSIVAIDLATHDERELAKGAHPFASLDDRIVFFAAPGDGRSLASIALDGGAVTTVATLPARIVAGAAGPDGEHVMVARDDTFEAWRIEPDVPPSPEGAPGLVIPAPAGSWRAVAIPDGPRIRLRLVAAGASLASGREVAADSVAVTWLDDHRLAYVAGRALHVIDVLTGDDQLLPGTGSVVAPDGTHWFDARTAGHTTRRLLVNFEQRPWQDTR